MMFLLASWICYFLKGPTFPEPFPQTYISLSFIQDPTLNRCCLSDSAVDDSDDGDDVVMTMMLTNPFIFYKVAPCICIPTVCHP